jgi:hypothetical protein
MKNSTNRNHSKIDHHETNARDGYESHPSGNNPSVHQQMNGQNCVHMMEYYSAIKWNEVLIHAMI